MGATSKDSAYDAIYAVRMALLQALIAHVTAWQISKVEAAKRLGISKSRLHELLTGRDDGFAVDGLIRLAHAAKLKLTFTLD